jgi:hypothetical protein
MSSTIGPDGKQSRHDRDKDGIPDAVDPRDGTGRDYGDTPVHDTTRRDYAPDGEYSDGGATGASATSRHDYDATRSYEAVPVADPGLANRETVAAREKEAFGGIKIGSAFFGWLTATGMAVLLTALVAAGGTAVGLATNTDVNEAVNQVSSDQTVGIIGIIVLLVVLFLSYYSGGYVAGRMARFNGAKQGLMVWLWAVIFAVVVALLGMIAGERFNILANLNSFPRIPINEGQLTTTGIIAAVVVAAVALVAAVLGGLAGMRFHRKVDRAGFTPADVDEDR